MHPAKPGVFYQNGGTFPFRVFITDLRYEHSIFCIVFVDFFVMYGAGFMPALLFYADLVINSTATPFRASAL